MAATTGHSGVPAGARWHLLLRPRWLAWHSFVVISTVGMIFLGDWQLHRAESGNELSWAYTFEWPLFAAFTVYFWIKSLRDELREHGAAASSESGAVQFAAAAAHDAGAAATAPPAAEAVDGTTASGAAGAAATASAADSGSRPDSWDATSWDAASWAATGQQVGADGAAKPVDVTRATPADGEAYVARLIAEVQRPGRRGPRP